MLGISTIFPLQISLRSSGVSTIFQSKISGSSGMSTNFPITNIKEFWYLHFFNPKYQGVLTSPLFLLSFTLGMSGSSTISTNFLNSECTNFQFHKAGSSGIIFRYFNHRSSDERELSLFNINT